MWEKNPTTAFFECKSQEFTLPETTSDAVSASSTENVNTDAAAESSTGTTEDKGVGSYLGAIDAALKEPEATPASIEPGSKEPAPEAIPGEPQKDPFELSDDEKKQFTASVQHRIRELAEVNRNAKAEAETVRQEVQTLKPRAEQMDTLTNYMREHEIQPAHLNNALGLTAMINKGQFDQALPILENLYQEVRKRAGETLPADLQQRVNLGYITEGDAKDLHKARTREAQTREKADRDRQATEQAAQQSAVTELVGKVTGVADKWTQEQQTSDPDWNLKRDLVTEQMELVLLRSGPDGYPRNEKATRELLDKAKKDVEARVGKFRTAPRAIDPPVSGSGASPRSAARPKSFLEAIDLGLANTHGG